VNSRLGLSSEEDRDIDFKTLGDNQLGRRKEEFPWQSPATVAHSWGFHALEDQWKSSTTLLHSLINNVSLNGNFMLNIGPRANGDVPHEISQRLREMGDWLAVNGESVYGSQAFDLVKDQHDWGKITCKKFPDGRTRLYLHVFNWPLSKKLPVTGIKGSPRGAYLLADKQKSELPFSKSETFTLLELPEKQPDPFVSVVVLEYDSYPGTEDGLAAQSVYGGFSLKPSNAFSQEGDTYVEHPERRGSVPPHVKVSKKSTYRWRICIDRPMSVFTDVSYNFQGKAGNGTLTMRSGGVEFSEPVRPTGRYVGEPNREWHIDSFNSHRMGKLEFSGPGYYEIELEVVPEKNEKIDFQWLWLEVE
jgi:alpha-L-fucosidase